MANFALIGAAGYVAPRHMRAISETGNRLIVAYDPSDSVGVLDSYFPDVHFFTEFERFDRHIDKLQRRGGNHRVDYVSICSPNYLHDAHVRFALRCGADVICEKPLVLNPWNLEGLKEIEAATGRRVACVLQLRLHPALLRLREQLPARPGKRHVVDLIYVTPRGRWYLASWKGDESKSGGVATNIGIHLFDLLLWLFGPVRRSDVAMREPLRASGRLELDRADVRWQLSADEADCARHGRGRNAFRQLTVDGERVEFSDGFFDLHTQTYRHAIENGGFRIDDVEPSIALAHQIRNCALNPSALPADGIW
ncbi:MAG: UDP-N-acetyl-2-amino-2-deoxy-D-glucuronate oxidase [Pseudomonadales bacterium]|nr:UDP-N-acetyl-2-amino-2-deoxy-D-glucuronate oxidase [Pseudomonadales bacterium]